MTSYSPPTVRDALLGLPGQWVPLHLALARKARFRCRTLGQMAVVGVILQLWQQQQQEREREGEPLSSHVAVSGRGVARELYEEPTDPNRLSVRRIVAQLVERGVLAETGTAIARGVKVYDLAPLLDDTTGCTVHPDASGIRMGEASGSGSTMHPDAPRIRMHGASRDRMHGASGDRMPSASGDRMPHASGACIERELCSPGAEQSSHEQRAAGPAAAGGGASAEPAAGEPLRLDEARRRKRPPPSAAPGPGRLELHEVMRRFGIEPTVPTEAASAAGGAHAAAHG